MCNCSNCPPIVSTKGDKGDPGAKGNTGDPGPSGPSGALPIVIDVTGTTQALTPDQTGALVILDRAAGSIVALPTAPPVGTNYDFTVGTSVTSNTYQVVANGSDKLTGFMFTGKSAADNSLFTPDASLLDTTISMNGSTTGGLIGTKFNLIYTAANKWTVSGFNYGSGSLASSFTH